MTMEKLGYFAGLVAWVIFLGFLFGAGIKLSGFLI